MPEYTTVSVKDFGAVGNGVANDTAAIQAAINASPRSRIIFPPGRYLITSAISVTAAPVTLDFSDRGATLVLGTQNMNGIVIGDGTVGGKNSSLGTQILSPVFNVKAGVAAFTSGACIFRNYAAFCNVYSLQIYGLDAGVKKLFNGVYDYKAAECDTPDAIIQQIINRAVHAEGNEVAAGGYPERTVDCNYDNLRATDVHTGLYFGIGTAGLGAYRPTIYGLAAGGRALHIASNAGPAGQNYFIDTPDFEAAATADSAIYLEKGSKAMIRGGWVGASMGYGLKIGTAFDSADVSCHFVQSRVLIEGRHNNISGGEIVGDLTTPTSGLTIKGANTTVASGLKIRQWAGNGIDWGGATPANVVIGQISFANNGTDIAPLTGFSPSNVPEIVQGGTDKSRYYTAAASLTIPTRFGQVVGTSPIATLARRGSGARITLQAGAGGNIYNNSGNLVLTTSPLSVPQYQTVSWVCDGANWFLDGKSF